VQAARNIALLSPLERSILGALQQGGGSSTTQGYTKGWPDDGGTSTMGIMAKLYPHMTADQCRTEADLHQGITKALEVVRSLTALHRRGLVHNHGEGRFCITVVGMATLAGNKSRPHHFGRATRSLIGAMGAALALSACSIFVMPSMEQGVQQAYPAQPMPKVFELQQFRSANGVLGFRICSSDCEAPTQKTVAVPPPEVGASSMVDEPVIAQAPRQPQPAQISGPPPKQTPANHYRLYFRFGASDFGPEALKAIKAALPDLKEMQRIEISAGTDPIGTPDQNERQIALRQLAVKNFLVSGGIDPAKITLVTDHSTNLPLTIRGMPPRTTLHAEMRQANLLAFR
jgi:outer membrane protein OmpA-like peptidoglycan-associated protein